MPLHLALQQAAIFTMTEAPQDQTSRPRSAIWAVLGSISRVVMIVPVIATFITALALMYYGALETVEFIVTIFDTSHATAHDQLLFIAIEIVDLFLLATVVQVVALGIYQLYFRPDLQLPKWLKIDSLDDLKSKLVGVTITVMAVFFLGKVIVWEGDISILYLGGGCAAVILALTFFLGRMDH